MRKANSLVPGTSGAIIRDGDLHVWRSAHGWKASGQEGDYGIGRDRNEAIALVRDVSATAHMGQRMIQVYTYFGRHDYTIHATRPATDPNDDLTPAKESAKRT